MRARSTSETGAPFPIKTRSTVTATHRYSRDSDGFEMLYDLEHDPDELVNVVSDPAYREEVRELSRQLADYGKKYNDPRAANTDIQADLEWAITGTGPYVSRRPVRPPAGLGPDHSRR